MNADSLVSAADRAAARRELGNAAALLAQASSVEPGNADIWKKLAGCQRALGRPADALRSITAALVIAPRDPLGLLMKGALLESEGADAEEPYRAALAFFDDPARLPAALRSRLDGAVRYCDLAAVRRSDRLCAIADATMAGMTITPAERTRINGFVSAIAVGDTTTVLPGLARPAFFAPDLFSGLVEAARAHARYAGEYVALIREGDVALPYVDHPAGVPLDQWSALNRSSQWNAVRLWRGGAVDQRSTYACPVTTAAFATLPVPRIPGRSPNLMFSILAPHTHIPRHRGMTNARLVVHIPLMVPPDCTLTVGEDTHGWTLGEALVFDDTIEHEASNDSDEPRVVLIGDIWHPELSVNERYVLSELLT